MKSKLKKLAGAALMLGLLAVSAFTASAAECHTGSSYIAWTGTTALPTSTGEYYLTSDVKLTTTPYITGDVTICLNGHNINLNGFKAIYLSGSSAKLTICDCTDVTTHGYIDSSDNLWKIDTSNEHSGLADEYDLTGGVIYGGTVTAGAISYSGYQNCSFTLTGGNIAGNKRGVGCGAYITFNMTGGSICGNSGTWCGGVTAGSSGFTMSGGSIVDNTGYGVTVENGKLSITGDVNISGNVRNEANADLYYRTGTINISYPQTNPIAITTYNTPTDEASIAITSECDADYSASFVSANSNYVIENGANNVVQLALITTNDGEAFLSDTDSGFYFDGDTKLGMVRFLFARTPEEGETITKVGIKYIGNDSIDNVLADCYTKEGEALNGAFYGDVYGIAENDTTTYYAFAYVVTDKGVIISDVVACQVNWDNNYSGYQPTGGAN